MMTKMLNGYNALGDALRELSGGSGEREFNTLWRVIEEPGEIEY